VTDAQSRIAPITGIHSNTPGTPLEWAAKEARDEVGPVDAARLGVGAADKPETMPSSFIIDEQGIVRYAHVGYHDGEEAESRSASSSLNRRGYLESLCRRSPSVVGLSRTWCGVPQRR
jgi:hypothetical protein